MFYRGGVCLFAGGQLELEIVRDGGLTDESEEKDKRIERPRGREVRMMV